MSQERESLEFQREMDAVSLQDAKALFRAGALILPALYLGFWVFDLIYAPEVMWLFLSLRLMMVGIVVIAFLISRRSNSLRTHFWLGFAYSVSAANIITTMILLKDGPSSVYYAGLNLVCLAGIWFVPGSMPKLMIIAAGIYGPYLLSPILVAPQSVPTFFLNVAFIIGTTLMAFFIRHTHKKAQEAEVRSRLALRKEIEEREVIIKEKTDESVKLQRLSAQFSPQVVEAIKKGQIKFEGFMKRAKICAVFIDIVNSTERVVSLDRDHFDAVLRKFMEECFGIFLKYDLTIDKFLGDGILAFSNEPVSRADFIQRTCYAVTEIRARLEAEADYFDKFWKKKFEIRAGIAVGYANVGFHGSDRYYKTYTAIGKPLAMASRLCSAAEPGQILIDGDIADVINEDRFECEFIGKKQLRGFDEIVFTYELKSPPSQSFVNTGALACPACMNSVMTLELNNGIYYMKCKSCEYVADQPSIA